MAKIFLLFFITISLSCGHSSQTIEITFKDGNKDTATYYVHEYEMQGSDLYVVRSHIQGGTKLIRTNVKYIRKIN